MSDAASPPIRQEKEPRPTRPIRIDPDIWRDFGRAVGERNRSRVLREFMAAYVGRPGAVMPKRPKRDAGTRTEGA